MIATSYDTGHVQAGERDALLTPKNYKRNNTKPGVIFCHGAGQTTASVLDPAFAGQYKLLRAIAEEFPVLVGDFGGTTWGNSVSTSRLDAAKAYLQGAVGAASGPVSLVGVSMGSLVAVNYARANPSMVNRLACFLPVLDPEDIRANNRGGYAASINAAYGGTYVEATEGATRNPTTYASSFGVPMKIWASADDPIALYSRAQAFASLAADVNVVNVGNLGHSEAAVLSINLDEVLSYLLNPEV